MDIEVAWDSNLLAAPVGSPSRGAWVLRSEPRLLYRDVSGERMLLTTRAGFDGEMLDRPPEKTPTLTRQFASGELRYRVTRELTVEGGASWLSTRLPSDLDTATGLTSTRADGSRATARSQADVILGRLTHGEARYEFSRDVLGNVTADLHRADFDVAHSVARPSEARLGVTARHFSFDDGTYADSVTLAPGWSQALMESLTLSFSGGPRFSAEGFDGTEASAVLRWNAGASGAALGYTRGLATVTGQREVFVTNGGYLVVSQEVGNDWLLSGNATGGLVEGSLFSADVVRGEAIVGFRHWRRAVLSTGVAALRQRQHVEGHVSDLHDEIVFLRLSLGIGGGS